ncbi:Geranylgeranyl pyrophosphate synthase [Smittium culicis]|uniref:Geranylgeranyl pyrophosphate synthase n=1 Tax=Smittium culicis TaxID=133412 RepID=A0A1R1XKT4_9FUNG|nr:Geranylgeranyl pyrophosphate synthase [Smittium culicis]
MGQGMDLYWRDNLLCPSESEYIDMVSNNIMRQKTRDENVKHYAANLVLKSGSFIYTEQYLANLESEIRKEIDNLGGNQNLSLIVDYLSINNKSSI